MGRPRDVTTGVVQTPTTPGLWGLSGETIVFDTSLSWVSEADPYLMLDEAGGFVSTDGKYVYVEEE